MNGEVASLLVRVTADGSQAIGVLSAIESTVGTLASRNATMMNKIAATGNLAGTVGRTITKTVGVATVAGLVASAKAAGQLNKELANIGTLSVPTERLNEFKGQIQDIAIATGKSTSDISEGTYQVVSAFGDASDTMEKVKINAKAAQAGLATTADSINLTSAVTKAYGDTSAAATQKVADLAFKTVELGQTTFSELASNMQQVTSESKELGVSQEELFAVYATLTGVTGHAAEVQTQLKAVYNGLLKPSKKMAETIEGLGYESGYAMINTLGLAGTLVALTKATDGSEEAMLGLFNNQRALPAILALTGAQADVFVQKLEKMKNASGAATKAFEVQTEGVAKTGFTLEQAKVKVHVAAQKFGESAAPLIGDAADLINQGADALSNMSDEQRKSIINTGATITKWGVGLAVGGKAVTMGVKLASAVTTVGTALGAAAVPVGITAAAVVGLGAAVYGIHSAYEQYRHDQLYFAEGASQAAAALKKQRSAMDEVNDYTWEFKDLQTKLHSDGISEDEKNAIVARMKEIAQWFEENYDVTLSVDSNTVADAAENVRLLDEALQDAKADTDIAAIKVWDEIEQKHSNFVKALADAETEGSEKWDKANAERWRDVAKGIKSATTEVKGYLKQAREIHEIEGTADREVAQKALVNSFNNALRSRNLTKDVLDEIGYGDLGMSESDADGVYTQRFVDSMEKELGRLGEAYTKATEQASTHAEQAKVTREEINGYQNAAREYISKNLQDIKDAVNAGVPLTDELGNIQEAVELAKLPIGEIASETALAKKGFESFYDAAQAGGKQFEQTLQTAQRYMTAWGASSDDVAKQTALMREGFLTLGEAAEKDKLGLVADNYIKETKDMGLYTQSTAEQIIENAALMREGFNDVSEVGKKDIPAVIQSLKEIGETQGIKMTAEYLDELAHKMELMPDEWRVTFGADGKIEIAEVQKSYEQFLALDGESVSIGVNVHGETEKIELTEEQVKKLQSMGVVNIGVDADGNVELLNEAEQKIGTLHQFGNVRIAVDADGNVTLLDNASEKVQKLLSTGQVSLKVNANGDIEILNQAQKTIGIIEKKPEIEMKIKASTEGDFTAPLFGGKESVDLPVNVKAKAGEVNAADISKAIESAVSETEANANVNATIDANTDPAKGKIDSLNNEPVKVNVDADTAAADAKIKGLEQTVTVTVNYQATGAVPKTNAKGTANFSGGLAMVNDQRGVADPRELIIDRGRAFIPEGRDVVLPLSKGAKVYTAAQTKAIMSGMGIPHYAEGKDNSDAFKSARDEWNHYTRSHAVTTAQELEKWIELSKRFTDTEKDRWDIEEQIFSLMKKQTQEMNEESKAYLAMRTALNDWDDFADAPIAAFKRIKDRNYQLLEDGKITWDEYSDTVKDAGETMYDGRAEQSRRWLDHEKRYNGMSADDYLAGIDRMRDYTEDYYRQGIIDKQKYIEQQIQLDEEYFDGYIEKLDKAKAESLGYLKTESYFDRWSEIGKDPIEAYMEALQPELDALAELGEGYREQYEANKKEIDTEFLSGNNNHSFDWIDEQVKYFGMSRDEQIAALQSVRDNNIKWFEQYGIGTELELAEWLRQIDDRIRDANDEFAIWQNDADAWKELRTAFGDWEEVGDTEADFYSRRIGQVKDFFRQHKISNEQYVEAMNRYSIEQYQYYEKLYDDALAKQKDYISDMREQFSKDEQALRDNWAVTDRKADIGDVSAQMEIYKSAVTDRGQQKYKDLQEELKKLRRDEQLYNLQVKNNAAIEKLETNYENIEDAKKSTLSAMRGIDYDISGYVNEIKSKLEERSVNMESLIRDLIDAVNNKKLTVNTTKLTDNSTKNTYNYNTGKYIGEIASVNLLR